MADMGRIERECPWCAENILAKAQVCKHCGRDVNNADMAAVAVLHSPVTCRLTETDCGLNIHFLKAMAKSIIGIAALLLILYLIKHNLTFSLTNFTFFLFLPIGPMLIGFAIGWAIIPGQNRDPLNSRWLVFFLATGTGVFFADQYFAYLHDGSGQGFWSWYSYLVEHRSWTFSFRGRRPQSANIVGDFGYVLEAIKVAGILYLGLSIYRHDRKLARAIKN